MLFVAMVMFTGTLKVVVVMTDGQHTNQYYLRPQFAQGASDVRRDGLGTYSLDDPEEGNRDGDLVGGERYFYPDFNDIGLEMWHDILGANPVLLTWPEVWNAFSVEYYAKHFEYDQYGNTDDYYSWRYGVVEQVHPAAKNQRLLNVCAAGKDANVTIYSIGFEAPNTSTQLLKDCASTPSHFYDVDGLEIGYAFASIANSINQLRLTQ